MTTPTTNIPSVAAPALARPARKIPWMLLALGLVGIALIAAVAWWALVLRFVQTTDDAYVGGDVTVLAPKVNGFVTDVLVQDNQPVKAGQVLIRLDDSSYKIAVAKAQANLAATKLQIDGLRATYKQRQSDVKAAQDTVDYSQREADWQAQLLQTHITSQQKYDEARHNLDAAKQQLSSAQQQLSTVGGSNSGCRPLVSTQVVAGVNMSVGRGSSAGQTITAQGQRGLLATNAYTRGYNVGYGSMSNTNQHITNQFNR